MRLIFVYWKIDDAGSAQDIYHYCMAGRRLGHEMALYAPEGAVSRIPCTLDIESADAAIFPLEWNIYLHNNEPLDLETPIRKIPRRRRVVIDCDGMYGGLTRVDGDFNHYDKSGSRARDELYDSISDKIFQPTLHPVKPHVGTFFFHGYHPGWEMPLDFSTKEYGMFYVGSNWFRWGAMKRILDAILPIRNRVGRIGLVGHNWKEPPGGADSTLRGTAYYSDPEVLKQAGVELGGPVPIEQVIPTMSKAIFNPVLIRPLFQHLGLVTVRTFETPAANTLPLFAQNPGYIREIYGDEALELMLPDTTPEAKILDVVEHPDCYKQTVKQIRKHLAKKHSYEARVRQLIEIVKN